MGTPLLGHGLESAHVDSLGEGDLLGVRLEDSFRQELSLVQRDEADCDTCSWLDLCWVGYRGVVSPTPPGTSPSWVWVMAPLQGEQNHKGAHQSIEEEIPEATSTAPGLEKSGISAFQKMKSQKTLTKNFCVYGLKSIVILIKMKHCQKRRKN